MTRSRIMRLFFLGLLWLPVPVLAVSHIDIRIGQIGIGEIGHPAGQLENLRATLTMDGRWGGQATLKQGDLPELAKLQALPFSVGKGVATGSLVFAGKDLIPQRIKVGVGLRELAFSDAEGLHAGEGVAGQVRLEAQRQGGRWNWSGAVDWKNGEVFWQPLYLAQGGVSLQGKGWLADDALVLEQGKLAVASVGAATLSARLLRPGNRVEALEVTARDLDAAEAYGRLLKPFLEKTLLGNLEMAGRADVALHLAAGRVQDFDVALRDFDVADKGGRFALYKVNARVPWALNSQTQASMRYAGGQALSMPLGAANLAAALNGYSLTTPLLRVPVLDGELSLRDVSAAFLQQQWHWHLSANLTPVSMTAFTHAVGWPSMEGKISAVIPMVTYSGGRMAVDGAMLFNVFDGTVAVSHLALQNPLGLAPRLEADIRMRDLDLDLLTRTFSFGAMTGRLDGDVNNMELSRWQPVKFDAAFRSSPGNYPKKISQRAVENISALGGAGAAAAIQRSFLRFFEVFHYARIGLSCKLRNGVCAMDGVEPAKSGYVIVKGSGIPAITVLGYNRSVSWGELLERVKRITQGNAAPIIK